VAEDKCWRSENQAYPKPCPKHPDAVTRVSVVHVLRRAVRLIGSRLFR